MADNYWDYWRTGIGNALTDTGTTSNNWYYTGLPFGWGTGTTTTSSYVPIVIKREILVEHPEHWTEEQGLAFVELVNIKTKTGWTVTLFIKGNVLITDPDVEKRKMEDFVPLLKKRASATDIELINKFFEENSCDKK
jgi:hypothetical protein